MAKRTAQKEIVPVSEIPDEVIGAVVLADLAQIEADAATHPDQFARERILRAVRRLREIAIGDTSGVTVEPNESELAIAWTNALPYWSHQRKEKAMTNPMEKLFEELKAKVLEQTMCDNCLGDFPDDEMNYDPNVRNGAPVCKECYEILTNWKSRRICRASRQ
jgi:hypothetical protein